MNNNNDNNNSHLVFYTYMIYIHEYTVDGLTNFQPKTF